MNRKSRNSKSSNRGRNNRSSAKKIERLLGEAPDRESMMIARNLKSTFLPVPRRPSKGARYTTRQLASTFTVSSGLSNVGGSACAGQLIQGGATAVYAALAFCLADLPQVSTLSALFDQYRIERIRCHVKARSNAVSVFNTPSPNGAVPTGYVVIDRDDSTALTAVSDAMQYDNVQTFNGEEDIRVDLVPSITPAVFATGAFSGYSTIPSDSVWIDVANTSVPHFGIKIVIGPLSATTTSSWVWDIIPEFVVSFKNTR